MSLKSEEVDFDELWSRIENLTSDVLYDRRVDREHWQGRFSDVYKICVATPSPLAHALYQHVRDFLNSHVGNLCEHIRKVKLNEYVDPSDCCADDPPHLEIKELGLYLWRQNMVLPLQDKLITLAIDAIKADRSSQSTNEAITKGVIHSFADVESYKKKNSLELYQEIFEKPFIESTGEWYQSKAVQLLNELNCSEYMKKVLQIIEDEQLRCTKFIHQSSHAKVIDEIRLRMVAEHATFLHTESENMVKSDSWQDLQAMYKLLKSIDNGLRTLIKQVQTHITQIGLQAIEQIAANENQPALFVESIIKVHRKHSDLIAEVFKGDLLFISALDKACAAIINHRTHPNQPCRSPELLAKYCDGLLRKNSGNNANGKTLSDAEIEEKLTQSIIVFKYIDDKDVFQKFYSKNMAKRLIHSQSASMEAEEIMINKLKQACGYEFTAKLHRMFTDIGVSNGLKDSFNDGLREKNIDLGINFSMYVLQAGSWPLSQSSISTFALPQILEKSVKQFESFYYSKFNGRILTWLHYLCTAEVRLCYTPKRNYQVSMQTYHMAILLLFESVNSLTYREIRESTQLNDEQLVKHLHGLIEARILLLSSSDLFGNNDETSTEAIVRDESFNLPTSSETLPEATMLRSKALDENVSTPGQSSGPPSTSGAASPVGELANLADKPETVITLNLYFSSKRPKFKIVAVTQRETQLQQPREPTDSEQTHTSIDEDRKLYIQAAIVRVMKSRKVAKHNQLIQEVIGLAKSHFTPSVVMIKKCIEVLIEKQYLERNSGAADEYKYVA
ncbi:Cullin-2, partial [Fragariocoptes setiger]